jgi:hypothetical protein
MKLFAIILTSILAIFLMYICLYFAFESSKDNFFKSIAFINFWFVLFQSEKLIRFLSDAK